MLFFKKKKWIIKLKWIAKPEILKGKQCSSPQCLLQTKYSERTLGSCKQSGLVQFFLVVRLGLLGNDQTRTPGSTGEGAGMQGGPCQPFSSHLQPLSWPEAPTLLPPGLLAQLGAQKETTERKENGWQGFRRTRKKPSTSGNLLERGHNCITSKI